MAEAAELPKCQPVFSPRMIRLIIAATARHFDVTTEDLLSRCRRAYIVKPRFVAIYLAKKLTGRTNPDLGRRFDDRHHTTILASLVRVHEMLLDGDPVIVTACREIEERVRQVIAAQVVA